MDLDKEILAHCEWRRNLKAAISYQGQLDAATLGRDDCCAFGKWLHGEGAQHYGKNTGFTNLVQKHRDFHKEAGKVASAINARHFEEARRMIEPASAFGAASLAMDVAGSALLSMA